MPVVRPGRVSSVPLPDRSGWPGLAEVPRSAARARAARAFFRQAVRRLDLRVELPSGQTWGGGGGGSPLMRIVREHEFFARLGTGGKIGFGEAYMVGAWTADDLEGVLELLAAECRSLVPRTLQKLRRAWQRRVPTSEDNSPTGARENIHRHYDLSNELFELFLDPTLTYSAAWFEPGDGLARPNGARSTAILDLARVGPGMHVLEIGSGWGDLAMRAAPERGARVTTLTLSEQQKELADRRIADAGLTDRIEVLLEDYRPRRTRVGYDAVVSVEMIEAVGERYWPTYFRAVDRMLAPGGRFGLQAITMAHERLLATRNGYTWMHKYVFPGGGAVPDRSSTRWPGTPLLRVQEPARSACRTCRRCASGGTGSTTRCRGCALGFDETFVRMWNFYLAYTEAGFRAGYLDVSQLSLARV